MRAPAATAALAVALAASCCDAANAFTCEVDSVAARTIPHHGRWHIGIREAATGTATIGWVKLALGFDWRLMEEPTFHLVRLPPSPNYTEAFFATIGTSDYCGSGGCTTSLYSCGDDRCKEIEEYFDGRIYFPGTYADGYPDFVIDKTDLYTHHDGQYRRVCRVTELPS